MNASRRPWMARIVFALASVALVAVVACQTGVATQNVPGASDTPVSRIESPVPTRISATPVTLRTAISTPVVEMRSSPTFKPSSTPGPLTATPNVTAQSLPDPSPAPIATRSPVSSPTIVPPTSIPTPQGPQVVIGDTVFGALLADTPAKRVQGLSGTPDLPRQTGMLFVFERGGVSAFWMKDMLIPLDFVWIGENCQVIEVTEEVPNPPPGTPDSSLQIYRPSEAAEYALEINAGEVNAHGIRPGDDVRFENMNSPNAHC